MTNIIAKGYRKNNIYMINISLKEIDNKEPCEWYVYIYYKNMVDYVWKYLYKWLTNRPNIYKFKFIYKLTNQILKSTDDQFNKT